MQNYGYTAFPYGQNYGYSPYGQRFAPQTPQMAQPQPQQPQMQMQPQMPMETPIQDIKFVNKAQAEAYIVYPNSRVLLIDKESGMAHLKTADNMGQSATQLYKFEAVNADGSPIKPQTPTPQFNPDDFAKNFVSVEQYQELVKRFEELKKFIGGKQNVATKQPEARM